MLAPGAAAMLALAGLAGGVSVAHIADGWKGVWRNAMTLVVVGAVMGSVQWALAVIGLWTIATFSAGLAGIGVGVMLTRRRSTLTPLPSPSEGEGSKELALSLAACAILVVLAIVVLVVPSVYAALGHVVIHVDFPQAQTATGHVTPAGPGRTISLLNHTGAILATASLLAFGVYSAAGRYAPNARSAGARILSTMLRKLAEPTAGIVTMVSMATMMSHAGMTDVLAGGLASSVGAAFPLVSPLIGALGAFMTGSNTNSNVVFVMLQMRTADLLRLSVPLILASQTTGAAVGLVISPAKVVVGCSSTEQTGREGIVMRAMLPYILAILMLIGAVTFAVAR
jgi:lactate permease